MEAALYMRNQLLRDTDWASMAHSLEVRTPLVDAVLLQHVAALGPPDAELPGKQELAASSLDAQFNALEDVGELTEVEARLAALKSGATPQQAAIEH